MKKYLIILLLCLPLAGFGQTTKRTKTDTISARLVVTDSVKVISPMAIKQPIVSTSQIKAPLIKINNDTAATKAYARYLISLISETDPVFSASVAFNIEASDTTRWGSGGTYTASNGLTMVGKDNQLGGAITDHISLTDASNSKLFNLQANDVLIVGKYNDNNWARIEAYTYSANNAIINLTSTNSNRTASVIMDGSGLRYPYNYGARHVDLSIPTWHDMDSLTNCRLSVSATKSDDLTDLIAFSTLTASANLSGCTYEWMFEGSTFSNDRSTTATEPGLYSIVVSKNGCSSDTAYIELNRYAGNITKVDYEISGNNLATYDSTYTFSETMDNANDTLVAFSIPVTGKYLIRAVWNITASSCTYSSATTSELYIIKNPGSNLSINGLAIPVMTTRTGYIGVVTSNDVIRTCAANERIYTMYTLGANPGTGSMTISGTLSFVRLK